MGSSFYYLSNHPVGKMIILLYFASFENSCGEKICMSTKLSGANQQLQGLHPLLRALPVDVAVVFSD